MKNKQPTRGTLLYFLYLCNIPKPIADAMCERIKDARTPIDVIEWYPAYKNQFMKALDMYGEFVHDF